MGTTELSWDDEYLPGADERTRELRTAFDVAARILGAALPTAAANAVEPDAAAGDDPLTELAELTELLRWLSGVRDELLFVTREAYELSERTGPGSWQELADALRITRTPARQQYEFVKAVHERGGGLRTGLLPWDAKHRTPPTAEDIRRDPRRTR